jgi:DNA/RNA-binding domain of Phe-tRNA-synthetase-like protein
MRYTVDEKVFALNPEIKFGIIIGTGLTNSPTTEDDEQRLRRAEAHMRQLYSPDEVKVLPNVALYREVMIRAGINPNRFQVSVEAMYKRILKGGSLPTINALVDLCNAVSIEEIISLGGHDLADIHEDLEVRFSVEGDGFLPFGETEYEPVEPGELVFTSGNVVQTRKWVWRQSELGKVTPDSSHIIFQLVGFGDDPSFSNAMDAIDDLARHRFGGRTQRFVVDRDHRSITF